LDDVVAVEFVAAASGSSNRAALAVGLPLHP
jgi:hypothetical protein